MIPGKVKVGGVHYDVEEKEFVEIDGNKNYMGKCSYVEAKIEIAKGLSKERAEETFVHELFHAVLNEAGYDEHDEELVIRASKVLYQVLRDNQLFFQGEHP